MEALRLRGFHTTVSLIASNCFIYFWGTKVVISIDTTKFYERILFETSHQNCHGQLLGARWWSTAPTLHFILFRCSIGPGTDEVFIIFPHISDIGKIRPKIVAVVVPVHISQDIQYVPFPPGSVTTPESFVHFVRSAVGLFPHSS